MAIKYTLARRKNLWNPEATTKYYAVAKSTGKTSVVDLCEENASISTVSPADTLAVMESLLERLPVHLTQNCHQERSELMT